MTLAFVVGATGYTGRSVVAVLREREVRAVAHVRPDSPRLSALTPHFEALGAEVDTTPLERRALAERFERLQPTLVFSLLGTTKARMAAARRDGRSESYESVDFALTNTVIEACGACRVPPRFVYLSAMGVRADSTNPYYRARAHAEEALRASGLPYLIARPSFISGDRAESRPLELWGARVSDAALSVAGWVGAGRLRRRYASMTGRQLAEGLVAAVMSAVEPALVLEAEQLRPPPAGP
ncbi:MAG: NAD(P)H-binding protein [Polyangiaceae bacterium]